MPSQKKRLQFDFDQDAYEGLERLVRATGASSKAEVVRRALYLFELVVSSGGRMSITNERGESERIVIV